MQINRCYHPQRGHDDRHQDNHEDGTEDGREHPALGVGFARLTGNKLANLVEPVTHLGQQAHVVGPYHVQYLGHRHGHQLATHILDGDGVAVSLATQREELFFQHLITIVEGLTLTGQLRFELIGQLIFELCFTFLEAQLL